METWTVTVIVGGFSFLNIAYAEYVKRSGAITVSKLDDRQKFTEILSRQLDQERKRGDDCEEAKQSLFSTINQQSGVINYHLMLFDNIRIEIDNLAPIHGELVEGLQESGLNNLAQREQRSITRLKQILEQVMPVPSRIGDTRVKEGEP